MKITRPCLSHVAEKLEYAFDSSHWSQAQSTADWIQYIRDELAELEEALPRDNRTEIMNELGDVLANVIYLCLNQADDTQVIKEIGARILRKLYARKPWVETETEPPTTIEEELEIWHKGKYGAR